MEDIVLFVFVGSALLNTAVKIRCLLGTKLHFIVFCSVLLIPCVNEKDTKKAVKTYQILNKITESEI